MTETRPPNCSDVTDWGRGEIRVNKCVGLRAGGAHENTSASSVSPLQLWGTSAGRGGGSLSWSPVAVFPETGFECRSGHLELLSWIYCVGGGQGQAVRLLRHPSLPQHEDSVSIGHGTDTGSTDKSLSRSLRRTLLGSEVTC